MIKENVDASLIFIQVFLQLSPVSYDPLEICDNPNMCIKGKVRSHVGIIFTGENVLLVVPVVLSDRLPCLLVGQALVLPLSPCTPSLPTYSHTWVMQECSREIRISR